MKSTKESASALRAERSLIFFNGQFVWHSRTKRGESYKFVSPAAVLQAMKAATVDTGWLPPGVVRAGSTARGDFAVMIVPAARRTIPFERPKGKGAQNLTLHLPAFAFFGHFKSYYVWALTKPDAPASARLFKAPVPNVFEDGRICWGQNAPPACSAATIGQAWALFMSAPFNGHAAAGKVKDTPGDVRVYLRKLAHSRAKFPADMLIPLGSLSAGTLDAAITRVIGGGE